MTPRDIEVRIQNLMDGTLTPDDRAALLGAIGRDPQLFGIYWDYVVLECAFARLARSNATLWTEQVTITETALRDRGKRRLRLSLAAAAAVLVLVGVVLRLMIVPASPPMVALRTSPGSILDITHSSEGKEAPPPGTLVPGSRAKIDQGTVELVFASGTRSIVRGPANLTLHAEGLLFLQTGTAWFHVPADCAGFKVQTPGMTVTDLGTKFGVRTRPDALDEVHVFQGTVEVRTNHGVKSAETLTAGRARAAGGIGHLNRIDPEPRHFLTELPASLPHLHWSFDEGPRSAAAEGSHPAVGSVAGRLNGLENPHAFHATEGRFGKALGITATFAEARSGWVGVEGAAPRTIAHWIKLARGGTHAQPIVGWGNHALTPFNANPAFLTYLRPTRLGTVAGVSFGAYYLNGTTLIHDDRWHHFVVVYSGRSLPDGRPELACYLDGRPEAMDPGFRADVLSPDAPEALAVRTLSSMPDSIPLTLFPRDWCGDGRSRNAPLALDELYIFEAALDPAQVKQLYLNNRIE